MPIISVIGRRQLKTRILVYVIYGALTLGAISMIYPFLLMLGGTTKSAVDTADSRLIPAYLVDDTALYRKHIEGLFNEALGTMQNAYGLPEATFSKLKVPAPVPANFTKEWQTFLEGPAANVPSWFILGYLQCPISRNTVPYNLRLFRGQLLSEDGSIGAINLKYDTTYVSASSFTVVPPNYLNRFVDHPDTAFLQRVEAFGVAQPAKWKCYVSLTNFYRSYLQATYGKSISGLNTAKGTTFTSWNEVSLPEFLRDLAPWARADSEEFVRTVLNPVFVKIDRSAEAVYQEYLKRKYAGDLALLNARHHQKYASFAQISLPLIMPDSGLAKSDWKAFLEGWKDPQKENQIVAAPLSSLQITGPDFAFREYLKQRHGSLAEANHALGTHFTSWETVDMPQHAAQYLDFQNMKSSLRWQFTVRNYVDVWNYLVVNGRGLLNTVIYCALAILAALTVDPIAAYALSRFKPRATYKVLLFLMMTMAFPSMVTQIPTFLLLRDLGLLNTFWALVLPGLANGYHIFLLKGFFDSLPRELYESAEIDGAGEFTIFWNITMALSKPILAVIALGAFTSAYAAFMFALLLCQDPKMWTLMVWLYQLQQGSGQGIIYASLIIAALPTFIVFLACQNIIMRGIVVPVEK